MSAFARLTDEKVTIIILGNRVTRRIYSSAQLAYDLFGDYQQQKVPESDEIDSLKVTLLSPKEAKKKNNKEGK